MNILFRVDASKEIGTGHVMRCLTLADTLKRRGVICSFVTRTHEGNLAHLIRERGFEVYELPVINYITSELTHSHWLGSSVDEDVVATMNLVGDKKYDWIIVDHYALDERWERKVRIKCRKLMVIDDLADRKHDCDILLDQNYFGEATLSRYDSLLRERTIKLLGPTFAILNEEYTEADKCEISTSKVEKVLIFLGGSDPQDETSKVIKALSSDSLANLFIDVVIGPNYSNKIELLNRLNARGKFELHQNLKTLVHLMKLTDFMIGAGGITNWERLTLGVPSIVISIADNQYPINNSLMDSGVVYHIGKSADVTVEMVADAIKKYGLNREALNESILKMGQFRSRGVDYIVRQLITSESY